MLKQLKQLKSLKSLSPKLEKKIQASLGEIFTSFIDHVTDVFWVRSYDHQNFYHISRAVIDVFGHPASVYKESSQRWYDGIAESSITPYQQFLHRLNSALPNQISSIDYERLNAAGSRSLFKERVMPIYDGKRIIAYVGVTSQILQGVGEERLIAEQFLNFFIEKTDSVFWVSGSPLSEHFYVNPAYQNIFGRSIESLKKDPSSWYDSVIPEDRHLISPKKLMDVKKSTVGSPVCRFRIERPNGERRWIREKNYPILSSSGELIGCTGIAEDITDDVRWEMELQEAKRHAESANQAKSDFLAMMSHELRTPLNAILGMAQILRNSTLSQDQLDQITVIHQSGMNLLSLLNDILDFTKIQQGNFSVVREPVDFYDLFERLIHDIMPQANQKGLLLEYSIERDVAQYLMTDRKRLQQILTNLIANAIKYTKEGFVRCRVVSLLNNAKQTTLCITVEDSGIGIEQAKLSTIFNRFEQIESVYQRKHDGVGLGLAIVKELIDIMGGSITVTSELSKGSKFSCVLPFDLQTPDHRFSSDHNRAEIKTGDIDETQLNLRILVVEDNKINQKIARLLLEQMGCSVEIAEDAASALEFNPADFDLIFMDLGLPDMDGFQAAQCLRAKPAGKQVPIIAMTAHVFAHDQERCYQVGMNEVVAKPIMREHLLSVLKRWSVIEAN